MITETGILLSQHQVEDYASSCVQAVVCKQLCASSCVQADVCKAEQGMSCRQKHVQTGTYCRPGF